MRSGGEAKDRALTGVSPWGFTDDAGVELRPRFEVRRPNIVFVLTDDLSRDLVAFMPQVQALRTRGLTFDNLAPSVSTA